MAKKKFDIDQGFEQLDEILTKLSGEEIKLPEAVKLYTDCLLYTSPSPRD